MQEGHCLLIEADRDLPVNAAKTPLGDLAPVADTEFDLGRLRTVLGPSNGELDHFLPARSRPQDVLRLPP